MKNWQYHNTWMGNGFRPERHRLEIVPLSRARVEFGPGPAAAMMLLPPEELSDKLDEFWSLVNFRGAAALTVGEARIAGPGPWPERGLIALEDVARLIAREPLLILNVLGRTRGQLLLPSTPLSLDARHLNRKLCTDDPRLVALAERTGLVR
ncbi:MAG: hypothetical protein AB1758_09935 [Candidatus Eremiobacterota bacterium]